MSEPNEGNSVEPGGGATANPQPSATQSQPSAVDLSALMKRLDSLEAQNKALQSGKDKRWNEFEPVIKRIAEILNVDEAKVAEAQRTMVLDDLVAEKFRPAKSETTSGKVESKAVGEVQAVVSALGLDPNDTEVAAIIMKESDPIKALAEFGKIVANRATKPQPTEAQRAAIQGGPAPQVDQDALVAELDKLLVFPTKNETRIKELEKLLGW